MAIALRQAHSEFRFHEGPKAVVGVAGWVASKIVVRHKLLLLSSLFAVDSCWPFVSLVSPASASSKNCCLKVVRPMTLSAASCAIPSHPGIVEIAPRRGFRGCPN